jgi:alpha-mannosidase
VTEPGVLVETAKWAEDEDALILRLYEAEGGARPATLAIGAPARTVEQVDLLERNPRALGAVENGTLALDLRAREVKTLRVRLAK